MEIIFEKIFSESFITFLCAVGIYAFSIWCYENFKSVFQIIFGLLDKRTLVEKYGEWAVITGCSDGIGLEYAKELAKKGFNMVLISRTESKLNACAREIESKYGVKTKTLAIDFNAGPEIYDKIEQEVKDLDVGVLVNNVGSSHHCPEDLENIPKEIIWQMIIVNVGAASMMTKMIIPQMKKNRRGIIVNVSSGTESQPCPKGAVYAASKVYIRNFTLALAKELEIYNIHVQLVKPMFVKTKMNGFSTTISEAKHNFFIADAETYAKWAVFTLGKSSHTTGYWSHGIKYGVMKLFPEVIRIEISHLIAKQFRREYFGQLKKLKN